jgi:N-acetylmuramoyl-L-alanine amidase
MTYNGMQLWLHMPLRKIRYRWSMTKKDMACVIDPLLRPNLHLRGRGRRVVVLDPGHGGRDRGARGWRAVEEKRVVLDVARRARVHLANEGLKVYLTRDGDRSLSLEERCRKAARWGADIFVSIHMNSSKTAGATGIETYVLAAPEYQSTNAARPERGHPMVYPGHTYEEANAILGYFVQRGLLDKLKGSDRGLRRAKFIVLKNAPCPAALAECGFVSNKREAEKMLSRHYRESIALGIVKGVLDYVEAVKRAEGGMQ